METLYERQQRSAAQGQTLQAGSGRPVAPLDAARANDVFDHFLNASTLKSILGHYRLLCDLLHLRPSTLPNFYPKLKQHLTSWRAKAVWKKFDARANNKVYGKGRACPETRVLIIGAGPCGLRTAIEAQMLGAKVVVLEKRDRMSRNNVLHLWPFVIDDLRSLGAKKFFGKFCAGSIDHISIRQLQCIVLKVALLLGVEIHTEVSYESLVEPSAEYKRGWRASVKPVEHPVSQYEFDVIIGADGKRNTLQGFKRKEFRGKLAIAITANFINRRTEAEARVEEISGVAFIFNQKFFKDLYAETQIDLENIVYYKDDTHYFVMTAKKHSLLSKSVIRSDQSDTARLLSPDNVDRDALMSYAREAAEFSTGRQMLDLEFAVNHYGQPDVAMFDFTSMYAAENASRVVEREGYRLLCILVGDSLLEPFWPTGSGCARGFLSSLDAAWAIRAWGSACPPLSVLAERESIYRLLGGTTPENLHRDSKSYSLDPSSRYPKLNRQVLTSHQVVGLYDTDDAEGLKALTQKEVDLGVDVIRETVAKRRRIDEDDLLSWIKKQIIDYNLLIPDLSPNTFRDGRILCAILHHYRPDLVDFKDLPEDHVLCCHIAIELLEKEIGIPSIVSSNEMATMECSRQQLISYLSQVYENFKREIAHINHPKMEMPELKPHTLTALSATGADPPMHHRNFAGIRATVPPHQQQSYIRQAVPLDAARPAPSADGAATPALGGAASRSGRKRKSAVGGAAVAAAAAGSTGLDHSQNPTNQLKNERDEDFTARIRHIEDKWYETTAQDSNTNRHNITGVAKKPKDLMRAIGKIETTDWNIREIEKKIKENRSGGGGKGGKERVPKWSREQFQARQAKMERKHLLDRQDSTNGKYSELDKNLKHLDQRLKEGTVRDLNQQKVAKITEQLRPKHQAEKREEKPNEGLKTSSSFVLPSANSSEYCHFCSKRVYLMEKLSAENRCFHKNCFRCEYCHTLLRPGAYKYDADGKYGHRFYCIHHYGFSGQLPAMVSTRNRTHAKNPTSNDSNLETTTPVKKRIFSDDMNKGDVITPLSSNKEGSLSLLGRVTGVDLLDRVQTPERIEFSNLSTGNAASSDHEEPPSIMDEDEWTDRNFGASTAEVGSSDEDDSYSDSDSEEEFEEAVEEPATKEGNLRILEQYSRFSRKRDSDSEEYSSSEQSSYCENTSGDEESDTATEGEEEIRARELRKQEVCLEPPIITDTGTDTEINSDDTAYSKSNEAPNSATEISTDSEFAQDEPTPTREIPSIVFNDAFVTKTRGSANITKVQVTSGELRKHNAPVAGKRILPQPKQAEIKPIVPNDILQTVVIKKPTNLPLLNRLTDGFPLNRTQSTSGIAAIRSLELKKRYLLGETAQTSVNSSGIQKSGSASTLDSKLKSFHSNITDCEKMLKPTQEVLVNESAKMVLAVEIAKPTNTSAVSNISEEQKNTRLDQMTVVDMNKTILLEKNDIDKKEPATANVTETVSTEIQPKAVTQVSEKFENELEGRPRSPVHETSIIVPKIDWTSKNKHEGNYSDSMSSDTDNEEVKIQEKQPMKLTEAVVPNKHGETCKLADLELLDSLNYIPSISDLAPKSISSEKKTLNQPKTLPGLYNKPAQSGGAQSGRSTPTQGATDSCNTGGFLTETELSDWARDGAVSDDFDYEYEQVIQTSRRHKEPKKLGSFADANNKDDCKPSLNLLDMDKNNSRHICGKSEQVVECVNSILNPDLKNIEYMDTGSENSSCSDDNIKKNNGYVQFYNDNDMAEDSLSPVINNLSKLTVVEVKNPLMTATIEDMTDFDELSTPTKNTGFCEVVVTPTLSSSCQRNFGGKVVDLNRTDLEELKQKQTFIENEMDSLQVIDTGTEDNTCSDSTVKNVEEYKPKFIDNNNVSLDKKRLEDKLMQVKQDMLNKKDSELFVEHCQRLQTKLSEFTNVRDSIDVRKNSLKNQPQPVAKPDLIQQPEIRLNLTPNNMYKKEVIAKERDMNQRLIHEMILNKYKTENKSLERKKRSRNNCFSPKTFELSKSATTVDLGPQTVPVNVTPDVILSTTQQQNSLQKSQTMSEFPSSQLSKFPPKPSDGYIPRIPLVQKVYTCYQVEKTPTYEKIRQEARAKAQLMSDKDLGLSPEDKILRLRERVRGFDSALTPIKSTELCRANSTVVIRDTKSGMPPVNRNSIAEGQFNRINLYSTQNSIYSNDTLNSKKRPKSFRRSSVTDKQPAALTTSKSVQNIVGQQQLSFLPTSSTNGHGHRHHQAAKAFKSDPHLLMDKSLEDFSDIKEGTTKKKSKDRERRKSITKVISDFFVSMKGTNANAAAKGFLAKISPKARERSKSCINLPQEKLVKETVSLRKSASTELHFPMRDASPPPVPPLPDNYTGNKLEDSSEAELEFQRHCGRENIDPAVSPHTITDSAISGNAAGSRRNSKGTAKRSARQAQLKRHRTAQEIQRKLEETEVKIRELELDGIAMEKRLRSEQSSVAASTASVEEEDGGGDSLRQWFDVMRDLTEWRRYERELATRAEELELEDRHARLQNHLRDKLTFDPTDSDGNAVSGTSAEAGVILEEMMDIVARRDTIIASLEQDKQRYNDEDREFEKEMVAKGLKLLPSHWKSIDSN